MKPDISTIYQRNETFDCILIFNLLHYYFSICIFIRFGMVQEMYFKILHARDLILVLSFYKRSSKKSTSCNKDPYYIHVQLFANEAIYPTA